MARKKRDLGTPALVVAVVAVLGAWWWLLGGRPPDLAMAPAQSTVVPVERPKAVVPREPPPLEEVAPLPLDLGDAERLARKIDILAQVMDHPVRCRLLYPERTMSFGMVTRHGDFAGTAVMGGEHLLLSLSTAPRAGPLFLEMDPTAWIMGAPPSRTAAIELVGDPLRCEPDPIVLPDPTNVAEITLLVRNGGGPGQTVVRGCGAAGSPDPQGRLTLSILSDHLDAGCTLSVTRRDGLLDVPGAEIELGPEDADGEITVDLPEARTRGLGVSLEVQGDAIVLLEIFEGTPGAAAGLQSGDRIVTVDGQPLPADLEGARSLLTGAEGSEVELAVENGDGVRIVRITRAFLQ